MTYIVFGFVNGAVVTAYLVAEATRICARLYFILKARFGLPPSERARFDSIVWR